MSQTMPSESSVATFCNWYSLHADVFRAQAEELGRTKMGLLDLVDELDDFVRDYAS